MGECDQATTESILDFYYDQVRAVRLTCSMKANIP